VQESYHTDVEMEKAEDGLRRDLMTTLELGLKRISVKGEAFEKI